MLNRYLFQCPHGMIATHFDGCENNCMAIRESSSILTDTHIDPGNICIVSILLSKSGMTILLKLLKAMMCKISLLDTHFKALIGCFFFTARHTF